jgi:hypothetical protein
MHILTCRNSTLRRSLVHFGTFSAALQLIFPTPLANSGEPFRRRSAPMQPQVAMFAGLARRLWRRRCARQPWPGTAWDCSVLKFSVREIPCGPACPGKARANAGLNVEKSGQRRRAQWPRDFGRGAYDQLSGTGP